MTKRRENRVSLKSLDWALKHILRHGDTDIFPVPFEFEVIQQNWDKLREELAKVDIGTSFSRPHKTFAIPKTQVSFRIAHQLDPYDSLLYTAQVYEMGSRIERSRLDKSIACSYRFEPTQAGDFFPSDNGWRKYTERSRALAKKSSHVLYVDIADFYNQIYHHRVETALQNCHIGERQARKVKNFLSRFTANQSQGIPVGPSGSHLLAECCLNDVDAFLDASQLDFVRYVDDFRIFSDRRTLIDVLAGLTMLLCSNHRLAVQGGKTTILETGSFVEEYLEEPGRIFEGKMDARLEALAEFLSDLSQELGYASLSTEDIPIKDKLEEVNSLLRESFEEAVNSDPVKTGTLRHLLREARSYKSTVLYPLVIDHLQGLIPIIREVCRYLEYISLGEEGDGSSFGEALTCGVLSSDHASCSYVGMWILHLLTVRPGLLTFDKALEFAMRYESELGVRPQALLARAHSQEYWVRSNKENLVSMTPWDRRAVIWASSILPRSERRAWLRGGDWLADRLDTAVAKCVKEIP